MFFSKPRIQLYDSLFPHLSCCCSCYPDVSPSFFRWTRSRIYKPKIAFFTDHSLTRVANSHHKVNIAWLVESPLVYPDTIQYAAAHSCDFDYVLTHQKSLLDLNRNFLFYPLGGSWIHNSDWNIYPKTQLVSLIASNKKELPGQKLRHEIAKNYNDKISLYGHAYKTIQSKLIAHRDYYYSVVIENCCEDYYFSEKLIDALACGSVPIYWGCPSIAKFFDAQGIITFNSIEEFHEILNNISPQDYASRLQAVKRNLELARQYSLTEDWIWRKYQNTIFQAN